MSTDVRYRYFALTNPQLQLLRMALTRSVLKLTESGPLTSDDQREEAAGIQTLRGMLAGFEHAARTRINVLLTDAQFELASASVKALQGKLYSHPPLQQTCDSLVAMLDKVRSGQHRPDRSAAESRKAIPSRSAPAMSAAL